MAEDILNKCIICLKDNSSKNPLVKKNDVNKINKLLERCKERVDLGENNLLPLLSSQHLENIRYHSDCRKPIMNTRPQRTI